MKKIERWKNIEFDWFCVPSIILDENDETELTGEEKKSQSDTVLNGVVDSSLHLFFSLSIYENISLG